MSTYKSRVRMIRTRAKKKIRNMFWLGVSHFFEYQTSAVVEINSCLVVTIHRTFQFTFLIAAVMWVMWFERGYQTKSGVIGGASVKVKGIGFTNYSKQPNIPYYLIGPRLWYPSDYVIPSLQTASLFIMTNAVIVDNQTQTTCPEMESVRGSICNDDSQCKKGEILVLGNGILTGRCIPSLTSSNKVCEIFAWCPLLQKEQDNPNLSFFPQIVNVTVMIKNNIVFPQYEVSRSNILSWMDKQYFTNCRFDPNHEIYKYCPIFRVGDIVQLVSSGHKQTSQQLQLNDSIFKKGGFIAIYIDWQCDLDWHIDHCLPKYRFTRLDNSSIGGPADGFNFNLAYNYKEFNKPRRQYMRVYGIRFIIIISGEARKFEAVTFFMNLGSILAFLGVATIICDFIVFNCTKRREEYKEARICAVKRDNSSIQKLIYSKRKSSTLRKKRSNETQKKVTNEQNSISSGLDWNVDEPYLYFPSEN